MAGGASITTKGLARTLMIEHVEDEEAVEARDREDGEEE